MSVDQVVTFMAAQQLAQTHPGDARIQRDAELAWGDFLRLLFPFRLSYMWRDDPVELIKRLDPKTRHEALKDFFESLGVTTSPPAPRTSGTSSPS